MPNGKDLQALGSGALRFASGSLLIAVLGLGLTMAVHAAWSDHHDAVAAAALGTVPPFATACGRAPEGDADCDASWDLLQSAAETLAEQPLPPPDPVALQP